MNNRRIKAVPVSLELVAEMCKQGYESHFKTVDGLPADVQFVGSTFDPIGPTAYLLFASEMFEEVPPHASAPVFVPVFHRVMAPEDPILDEPIISEEIADEDSLD